MGYNLSPTFVNTVLYKFDTTGRRCLTLDTFIQSMVMIKGLTDAFKARDVHKTGNVQMGYEDFLTMSVMYKP
jgi:Ca2+-binding EF-hand superfamily protein